MLDDRMLEDIGSTPGRSRKAEPQAVLEGVMNRRAKRQPATIAVLPWDTRAPSSRPEVRSKPMVPKRFVNRPTGLIGWWCEPSVSIAPLAADPQESSTGPEASALPGTAAARILEELDQVVRKSHRPSALRRRLNRMGSAFARLWSKMAPEMPAPQSDQPLEIRFPWFFL